MWLLGVLACGGSAAVDTDEASDTDRTDTDVVSEECFQESAGDLRAQLCLWSDDHGPTTALDGVFTEWSFGDDVGTAGGEGTFVDTSGVSWRVENAVGWDLRPYWPDLVAAGEVTVVYEGYPCPTAEDFLTGTIVVHRRGDPDDAIVALGRQEATPGGWTVTMGPLQSRCPARDDDGCYSSVENQALTFTRGDVAVVLPQSASAQADGFALTTHRAQRGVVVADGDPCEYGWPEKDMSWSILRAP